MTDDRPGMRVVATAGHVDHGKSTLLRALTGMEPDRWEEERRRGLTIDLGFVWTDLDTPAGPLTVAFVDVPGHERFVANMLAGAGAAPLALFVVAADDGWAAHSREHLDILDLLGVPAAVVAITKLRIAGDERAREVATDVGRRLAGTSLDGAPIMIVDGVSGEGVDGLRDQLSARLAATPDAPDRDRPRLWVDRAFTISGAGTVVTGTLAGGALQVGQELALLPLGRTTRIRGMQALGKPAERVDPGARVALN
ncbi:MAG: GTP-binding protein, partial [Nitriliruptorales bacterium]